MSSLFEVILYASLGGVISLLGGILLVSSKKRASALATYATPFAAGALLAAAFLDLLREASESGSPQTALRFALGGILVFFFLERFLRVFHHHHEHEGHEKHDPTKLLIIIGDTLHNFIDGVAIAAGFLVDTPTGIVVTVAVAAHEIPQEIGDFGLLLKKGMSPKRVIMVNFLSAIATLVGAAIFYQLGSDNGIRLDMLLGLVAGFFIYIAVSDIIPSIHKAEDRRVAGPQTLLLVLGVVAVGLVTTSLHNLIDSAHDHEHEASSLHDEADEHEDHGDTHEESHQEE